MDSIDPTIRDFGEQWTRYRTFPGYIGSQELLQDFIEPLLSVAELQGRRVCEIGAGQGRIVTMLMEAGAAYALAIEPSHAFTVLQENVRQFGPKVECQHTTGERIPSGLDLDYVFSLGVLHHVRDPMPIVRAARQALRPGGRMLIWLYGREGNEMYLRFALPLRAVSSRLPGSILAGLSHVLAMPLSAYVWLCRFLKLPMHQYMRRVLAPLGWRQRMLTVYDQLNPRTAKYYTESEARALLQDAGFSDVKVYHRHGYSWTVIGKRPAQ